MRLDQGAQRLRCRVAGREGTPHRVDEGGGRAVPVVASDVRAVLGAVVFQTVIPRNVRLSEAPSHGLPALIYDHRCSGSEAYIALAREMIARLPRKAVAA